MIEGRAIISDIEDARVKVERFGAIFKGEYAFRDVIFVPMKAHFRLSDDVLRMRVFSRSNSPSPNVVLVRKQTEFSALGKTDNVILKNEFDTEKEALDFVQNNLSAEFTRDFEFSRVGWQYQLENQRIFIEDIMGFPPMIEFEAETEDQLKSLFEKNDILEKVNESMPEFIGRFLNPEATNFRNS